MKTPKAPRLIWRSRDSEKLKAPSISLEGSSARFFDLVAPHLPPGLVGPDSKSHIHAAVGNVPAELVARFAFRCRLDVEAPGADIAFGADAQTGGLQMFAGRHPLVELPPSGRSG